MDCDGSVTPAWTGRARLNVLIDGENASARHAQAVFEAAAKLGEATVRRIYGDFSNGRLASWNAAIRSFAIVQHQQPAHARGKNAADIALVIDAMDLMYREWLDGFCLMSSDSDFTRLAQRLREAGFRSTASANARLRRRSATPATGSRSSKIFPKRCRKNRTACRIGGRNGEERNSRRATRRPSLPKRWGK